MSPLITPEKPPVRLLDIEEVQDAIEQAWDDSEEEWGEAIREYVIARVAELLS